MPKANKIVISVLLVLFLFYLNKITSPVPNFDEKTKTLLYDSQDDVVAPNSVSISHVFIGAMGVLALAFLTEKETTGKVNASEVRRIVKEEINVAMKDEIRPLPKGELKIGIPKFKKVMVGNELQQTSKWLIPVTITNDVGKETYYLAYVDMNGDFHGALERGSEFTGADVCWQCGTQSDTLYITPAQFGRLKENLEQEKVSL